MDHLPFLVVHGAVVWCVALVVLVGASLALVWWLPRRAARARRRQTLQQWSSPVSPSVELDGQTVTLAGRLVADGCCRRFDDDCEAAAVSAELTADAEISERAPRLWLEMDQGRVELEGEIWIAIGSHESWPDRPFEQLPLPLQARLLGHGITPDLREGRPVFRALHSGDEVVALGVLGVVGAVGEADYRQPAHRFVLRSVALASHGPPRVRGVAREHAVRRTLAAGALFLCVFGAGGAGDLSNLALRAEAVGDRELAQELATGLHRIRAASLRRDIAMPLAILERYPSPPAWE